MPILSTKNPNNGDKNALIKNGKLTHNPAKYMLTLNLF